MKAFHIVVTAWAPYPREFVYQEAASHIAPAVSRALRKMKKDLGRKRCDAYNIKVTVA